MTDNRYSHLHYSDAAVRMLEFAFEDEEQDFGRMVGFDEAIEVPYDFEPPVPDEDESTLPSRRHPSYPYGRPVHLSHPATTSSTRVSLSRMRGRNGVGVQELLGRLGMNTSSLKSTKTMWNDFALDGRKGYPSSGLWTGLLEEEEHPEVPMGMAGAKRPPTPPSPTLRPQPEPEPSPDPELYYGSRTPSPSPTPSPSHVPVEGRPNSSMRITEAQADWPDTFIESIAERMRQRRIRRGPVARIDSEGAASDREGWTEERNSGLGGRARINTGESPEPWWEGAAGA